jgi:predicted AAA+ superfamily ATPase
VRWKNASRGELEAFLRFGSYPEVINAQGQKGKIEVLKELSSSYLYKDVLEFQQIRNAKVINDLLRALALQIGSQVSYSELASLIGIDRKTVERYVDLLEKNYIIFRHPPYSKNIRRTISRMNKIYFFDLGMRNAILNDFNELENRNDVGALWENFLAVERLKFQTYHQLHCTNYFLRTYDGAEIDWLEASGGKLAGFEFKWKRSSGTVQKTRERAGIVCSLVCPDSIKGFII